MEGTWGGAREGRRKFGGASAPRGPGSFFPARSWVFANTGVRIVPVLYQVLNGAGGAGALVLCRGSSGT